MHTGCGLPKGDDMIGAQPTCEDSCLRVLSEVRFHRPGKQEPQSHEVDLEVLRQGSEEEGGPHYKWTVESYHVQDYGGGVGFPQQAMPLAVAVVSSA